MKQARCLRKKRAKKMVGGPRVSRLISPNTEEQAVALLGGFNTEQLALLMKATQRMQENSEPSSGCEQGTRSLCG